MSTSSNRSGAGTVTAAWTLAGGIAGGMLIAMTVIAGRIHPEAVIILAVGMATIGSMLGGVHGAVLGQLGHSGAARPFTVHDALLFLAVVAAAFVAGVLLGVWLALSATIARAGLALGWVALAGLGTVGGGVLGWASVLGWRALEHAYTQWPDHRLGGALVLGAFAVLSAVLVAVRPAIPGTQLQLPALGLLAVAALATVWVAAPAVILTLRLAHRERRPRLDTGA